MTGEIPVGIGGGTIKVKPVTNNLRHTGAMPPAGLLDTGHIRLLPGKPRVRGIYFEWPRNTPGS
jgi:hypothetical protein